MKHLLVIRLSALGDVAIMAPVVTAWAEANPDVRFTVAAPPLLEPLFEGPSNLTFLGVNKKQRAVDIYRQLLGVGADTVADLHQINKVGWALTMLWLHETMHLHLRFRIHRLHKGRWTRFLMIHHLSRRPRRPQHQRYADVFRRLGLKEVDTLEVDTLIRSDKKESTQEQQPINLSTNQPINQSTHKRINLSTYQPINPSTHKPINLSTYQPINLSTHRPTIGLAPFAQHEGKIWPFERTERLAAMLCDSGYHVMLFGSRDEAPRLEQLAATLPNAVSMAGKGSFRDELDTIRHLNLMVTMDSSNMHFASAVGTPVVSIWGATHPDFGFYGYRQPRDNALCANLPCQPCSAYGQRPCRFGDHRCLLAITPEQVLDKINQILPHHSLPSE